MPVQSSENARARLLASLNDGRPAAGELQEAQLQSGDQVYSDGDTLAVVRLEGLRRSLYWLTGPVDLQRVQYSPQGRDQYQVTGPIDPKAPPAHRAAPGHHVVAARVPPAQEPARARMERQYNNGRAISNRLQVAQLQSGDRLLVDGTTVLAVRREGNLMTRYWLDGSIDLGQTGVQKVDANLYQVTGVVH